MNVVAVVGSFIVIAASVDMSHDHCDETFQQSCDCDSKRRFAKFDRIKWEVFRIVLIPYPDFNPIFR